MFLNQLLLKYKIQESGQIVNEEFNKLLKANTNISLHLAHRSRDKAYLAPPAPYSVKGSFSPNITIVLSSDS